MAHNPAHSLIGSDGRKTAPAGLTVQEALDQTRRFPDNPRVWLELAQLTIDTDAELALAAAQKLAQLLPNDYDVRVILGKLESMAEQYEQARKHYERALEIKPDDFDMLCQVASLHLQVNKNNEQALDLIDRALAQQPRNIHALYLKAYGLILARRYDEATDLLHEQLIPLDPANAYYWNLLGQTYRDTGEFKRAEASYLKSIALAETAKNQAAYIDAVSNRLTLMHYMPEHSAEEILQACREWGALFAPNQASSRPRPATPNPGRKIRLGLYADGFSAGPVSLMITAPLEHLRRFGFDIYLYANNPTYDHVAQRLIAVADRHATILQLSNEQFAQRIRDDGIDILVDLAGYNTSTRMSAMALEPAPLLVKWVGGLINTTGLPAIDYLITDRVESPLGSDAFFTEKLIRMPDDYICYLPPPNLPDVGLLPARRNGYITLGCFNNPTKINEVVLEKWASIMRALPNSHLFLKGGAYDSAALRRRVQDFMQDHGIAADRLRLEGQATHFELLRCYNEVDVALDPWPYSGGLTTCEALLMGVPVVTLPGPTFAGRHSATHLAHAGIPELVAQDWDQYQSCALALASDLDNLSALRTSLRKTLLDSPVCDGPRYARHLATALRAIWQRYCEGKPRASLVFTSDGKPWFEDSDAPMQVVEPDAAAQAVTEDSGDFQFQFRGKIIALDHGGSFIGTNASRNLSNLGSLITIAIDPANTLQGREQEMWGRLIQHHHHHVALGDGAPATLYLCRDSTYSGTLAPLPASRQLPALQQATEIVGTHTIPTVRLDELTGLEKIDWLILNGANDNAAILQSAQRLLPHTLIVQAQTAFVDIFERQTDLANLSRLLAAYGLRLLAPIQPHTFSYFPEDLDLLKPPVHSQWVAADAVFVPDENRLRAMDDNQRWKLAYLLHSAYNAQDLAYQVLQQIDRDLARRYLCDDGWLYRRPPIAEAKLPSAQAASEADQAWPAAPAAPEVRKVDLPADAGKEPRSGSRRPFVSIVIPTYNRANDLRRCLHSALAIDCDDMEIIVSDNASPDNTQEVIQEFNDPRIRAFRQKENIYGDPNFLFIIEAAAGEWIITLTDDDWILPQAVSVIRAAVAANPNVGFILSPLRQIDANNRLMGDHLALSVPQDNPGQPTLYNFPAGPDSLCTLFWHGHIFTRWIMRKDIIDLEGYKKQIGKHAYAIMWMTSRALLTTDTIYTSHHVATHRVFNETFWSYPDDYMYGGVLTMIKELLADHPAHLDTLTQTTADRALGQVGYVKSHGEEKLERYVRALMGFPEFTSIPRFIPALVQALRNVMSDERIVQIALNGPAKKLPSQP
ncbi:glycosyltransferase [Bordetella sp. FB-8]|uniref:O-linked N-acetylglucosamine transferase family protein n=1 Tax=Bordetella sp. FB-8 TaxID=1159870 RepID=UPI0009DAADF1|nr:glycosyltransferase [Bordetella sp. FB-8]